MPLRARWSGLAFAALAVDASASSGPEIPPRPCGTAEYRAYATHASLPADIASLLSNELGKRVVLDPGVEFLPQDFSDGLPALRFAFALFNGACAVVAYEHHYGGYWIDVMVLRRWDVGWTVDAHHLALEPPLAAEALRRYLP